VRSFIEPDLFDKNVLFDNTTPIYLISLLWKLVLVLGFDLELPLPLPLPSGWTTSSAEAVHQLRPNAQPQHNQRLGKSISSSYELERMHNLHRIKS